MVTLWGVTVYFTLIMLNCCQSDGRNWHRRKMSVYLIYWQSKVFNIIEAQWGKLKRNLAAALLWTTVLFAIVCFCITRIACGNTPPPLHAVFSKCDSPKRPLCLYFAAIHIICFWTYAWSHRLLKRTIDRDIWLNIIDLLAIFTWFSVACTLACAVQFAIAALTTLSGAIGFSGLWIIPYCIVCDKLLNYGCFGTLMIVCDSGYINASKILQ